MAFNLYDHIIQTQYGFVTLEELTGFCQKHGITTSRGKKNLVIALEGIGAKPGFVKWNGSDEVKKAYIYICLTDFSLHKDKQFWGRGVTVWE
jgi:hypothetical protein